MVFVMNGAACQLDTLSTQSQNNNPKERDLDGAIWWGLLAVLVTGWPFCGVLFVPLGLVAIHRAGRTGTPSEEEGGGYRRWNIVAVMKLLARTISHAVFIQSIVTLIDYHYYGEIRFPTWNVFIYNTGLFGGDGINRDDLYGVEGVDYYIRNLLLNWNVTALIGILALPCLWMQRLVRRSSTTTRDNKGVDLVLFPMFLWIGVLFTRPHKEERFLFPIYPMLAIGTAVFLDLVLETFSIAPTILRVWTSRRVSRVVHREDATQSSRHRATSHVKLGIGLLILIPTATVSILRSMALVDNYIAPLETYAALYHNAESSQSHLSLEESSRSAPLICTGGEWYRFPSSFHIPNNARLAFLQSSFGGQLPQQFTKFGSRMESLSIQTGGFNNMNVGSMDRYVDIEDCSYVVELVVNGGEGVASDKEEEEPECVGYMKADGMSKWREGVNNNFVDIERTSMVHRVVYVPFARKIHYKKFSYFHRTSA